MGISTTYQFVNQTAFCSVGGKLTRAWQHGNDWRNYTWADGKKYRCWGDWEFKILGYGDFIDLEYIFYCPYFTFKINL